MAGDSLSIDTMNVIFELLKNGKIKNAKVIVRKLSNMKNFYYDQDAVKRILETDDPIIYEVYAVEHSKNEGDLSFATTIINPGKIGNEYYMTKGHFHERKDAAEIYIGISGVGKLLMQDEHGKCVDVDIKKDTIVYVPPKHAHRSINVGEQPLVFLAIYPSNAGHDYGVIEKQGFAKIVIEDNGIPKVVKNPSYSQ